MNLFGKLIVLSRINKRHYLCYYIFFSFLEGYTGGSWYTNKGAAVDALCLPRDPEWGNYRDGTDGDKAYVLGAEYQTYDSLGNLRKLHNHDVPCAVCFRRNRSVVRMFPGASDLNS